MTVDWWIIIGFIGQGLFFMRFVIQWITSERQKKSVIPVQFWFWSIGGSLTLFAYALHQLDPVFIAGQSLNSFIYIRNLMLISRQHTGATP